MEWTWLLALVCPIMMLFMMKGMHGGHRTKSENEKTELDSLKARNVELTQQISELQKKQIH
ncbi:DUF2933 domain-containing protein [Paenibacillus sp. GYB004]|uniref:DUF2933 domain-containing protein n=1 Tax=Paenibacillus sp. GYB004 TaxID=2994393 RepID=UPI002F96500D